MAKASVRNKVKSKQDTTPSSSLSALFPVQSSFALRGIFFIMLVAALYFARDFFLPVTIAFILALTLSPVVRFFSRMGVNSGFSAFVVVTLILITLSTIVYAMAVPVSDWINRAPEIGFQLKQKLSMFNEPMQQVIEAQKQVEDATNTAPSDVQQVTVQGPGLFTTAASSVLAGVTTFVVTLVLLTFVLGSGDLFYAKLVESFDTMGDKKRALTVAHDVERVVSRYLFTITLINVALGIVIGVGLYLLGMPTPYIWGAVAALANFMPFIGAIMGLVAVTLVAIVSFDAITTVLLVSGFYFTCTFVEGQFITPLVVGRRLELNAPAIFIAVAFWAWLWGIVGALIAVPILVVVKTICDHFESTKAIAHFLAARETNGD